MTSPARDREFAVEVVRTLQEAGYVAMWAGGCVRDLLMGRVPDDFDVATNATPEQVRALFGQRRTLAVGESFGVVLVLGPPRSGLQVEVATFRSEGDYADGRRPDNVRFTTAEEDAQRRDFTINGMFYDPIAERVHDFVGGEQDLHAGILRAIGDPLARMREDKLRMLRAVRLAATLDFELDQATAAAVRALASEIRVVSWERIAQELRKMLRHRHRRRAVRLMQQLGLLEQILPELIPLLADSENPEWVHLLETLDRLDAPRFEVAAAVLLCSLPVRPAHVGKRTEVAGTVEAACRRLRFSNQESEEIAWLVGHRTAFEGAERFPTSRLKRLLAHPLSRELLQLAEAESRARNCPSPSLAFVRQYLETTPPEELDPPPLVTGADLLAQGLPQGPRFKELLGALRDAQLDGRITTQAEAIQLLHQLAAAK